MRSNQQGITWIEVLLALAVVSILLLVAVPIFTIVPGYSPVLRVLNDMRELQLVTQQMVIDQTERGFSDTGIRWTCSGTTPLTLNEWKEAVIDGRYLTVDQYNQLMTYVQKNNSWFSHARLTNSVTVYAVTDSDPPDTLLLSTANWHSGIRTNQLDELYGHRDFAVFHKAGDGMILQESQATNTALIGSGGIHNYLPLK